MSFARPAIFAFFVIATSGAVWLACDDSNAVKEALPDAGAADTGGIDSSNVDSGGEGGSKDCFDNPTTHFEIINACTAATKITKNPTLPKLLPDGGLPPLL